jgi:hypothetical protein
MKSRGKKSSGKSGKESSKQICLEVGELFEISGTTEVQIGQGNGVCLPANWNPDACVHYVEPFMVNRDVGNSTTFVFNNGKGTTDPPFTFTTKGKSPPMGDTALCGSVNSTANDKLILEYFGEIKQDLADLSGYDLHNKPLTNLQSVKYSFWVESCPVSSPSSCPKQFYLNIYARKNATSTSPWYDCNFAFVPNTGGVPGTWTTFDLQDIKNIAASAVFGGANCLGATTIQEYIDATGGNAVLGNMAYYVFAWNIGDSAATDQGISGCYDAVHIKMTDESATRVYDF